ncbi:MAG: hypothetical protein JWL85_748 [Candidatus Saccharibacteria bacterium]|nr:hypothetical protein [Candidatus Saccharibacteria bacterium]
MDRHERSGADSDIMRVNETAAEAARSLAEKMRGQIIEQALEAVKGYLRRDLKTQTVLENGEYSDKSAMDIFVLADLLAGPSRQGDPQWCYTLELVRNGEDSEVEDRLHVALPVPEGLADFGPENLVLPEEIYLCYENPSQGKRVRYIVNRTGGIFEYETDPQTNDQIVQFDFSDPVAWQKLQLRVDTGLSLLGAINEDLINMHAKPQA